MSLRRFTAIEIAKVRECCAKGMSVTDTAALLGRNTESVRSLAPRLGIKFPKASGIRRSNQQFDEAANAVRLPPARYASRTAMMLGDPPIGRSALDQKRAAA